MRDPRKRTALTVLAAAVALTLTACTTSEDGAAEGADPTFADEGLAVDESGVTTFAPPRDGADLPAPVAELSAADAAALLDLERGSRNHLRAFVGQLDQRGFDHTATYLAQVEVDEILSGDIERGGA